jgi:cytochrome b subunit of formate dehydrogenase
LIPLYLFHVTSVEHSESTLWTFIICNIFVVVSGIVFMYRLFTQKSVKAAGIAFGVAILINYILIAIFGDFWDLLG